MSDRTRELGLERLDSSAQCARLVRLQPQRRPQHGFVIVVVIVYGHGFLVARAGLRSATHATDLFELEAALGLWRLPWTIGMRLGPAAGGRRGELGLDRAQQRHGDVDIRFRRVVVVTDQEAQPDILLGQLTVLGKQPLNLQRCR